MPIATPRHDPAVSLMSVNGSRNRSAPAWRPGTKPLTMAHAIGSYIARGMWSRWDGARRLSCRSPQPC